MTAICILGSRMYQPLSDVASYVEALPIDDEIVCVGISPVATTARQTAVRLRRPTRNVLLDPARAGLLDVARTGRVVIFSCDDRDGHTTEGTASNIALLREQGIPFDVIETTMPGKICDLLTRLRVRVEAFERAGETRRGDGIRKSCMQGALSEVTGKRISLRKKVKLGFDLLKVNDNDVDFQKWLRVLAIYQSVYDIEQDACRRLRVDMAPEIVPELSPELAAFALRAVG